VNVQLAAKKAASEKLKEKGAVKKMATARTKVLSVVRGMEKQLRILHASKKKSAKKMIPLASKETNIKSTIAKLSTKSKMNDIDFSRLQTDLKGAKAALSTAETPKAGKPQPEAVKAAKASVSAVEKQIAKKVKTMKKIKGELAKLKSQNTSQSSKVQSAQAKLAETSAAIKAKEVVMKTALKKEKGILKTAKLKMMGEKVKAYSAKLTAS
jgi:hypothetical protein